MTDAREITHKYLGDTLFWAMATALHEQTGVVLWEHDAVFICSLCHPDTDEDDGETMHVLWAAGDIMKLMEMGRIVGRSKVAWQRQIGRRAMPGDMGAKWHIVPLEKFFQMQKTLRNGGTLV